MQKLSQYVYKHDFTGVYFCALHDCSVGQEAPVLVQSGNVFKCHGMFMEYMLFYASKAHDKEIITTPDNRYRVAYKNEEKLCRS